MPGEGLEKLLDVEKEAVQRIESAKEQAKKVLTDIKAKCIDEREGALTSIEKLNMENIQRVRVQASIEAEKIRRDGESRSVLIKEKARARLPIAVERVLKMMTEEGQGP